MPLLEAVDSTSLRVHFSPPPVRPGAPAHDFVTVHVSDGGAVVDAASSTLKPGLAFVAVVGFALVKGLSKEVSYRAKVSVRNIHGWGAHSPSSEPLQLPEPASPVSGPVSGPASPEVEVTGSKSREERDAELRKRSVDVDAEVVDVDAPRYPKRSKQES